MNRRKSVSVISAALLCILAPVRAEASVQIFATSYDMPNGGGTASGGGLNYWDLNYSGSGFKNVDGAALSGGLGDLTDGTIATNPWFDVENGAGTGPYVGWFQSGANQLNPILTFNFAGNPLIDQVVIHLDNSSAAGVYAPSNILIDGNSVGYVAPVSAGLYAIDFSSLSLLGNQHTIQFFQASNTQSPSWVFVSEIQFFGSRAAVPEPATWTMMLVSLVAVGLGRSRLWSQ